ncbi:MULTISPECIES: hypothetical protein [unclassified Thermosynechococcus]|uniref:hypothetical protein n=1 Tax=unclassified Thermosynechococcus TaxID=2622553 RepID=UPI0028772F72|nr:MULTISPECIES: hypothetical protein [unclassified Thermosynechococcus]WNC53763.1 hypothetical protein RHJ02_05410 [Thermosynechococcus sp. TG215]WNC58857.1 hypothetical protein RHJ13_05420 [Thermosynechococcus sp. TG218]
MGIAIASFIILFLLSEAVLHLRQWVIPFPVVLIAAVGLVVASNWSLFRRE